MDELPPIERAVSTDVILDNVLRHLKASDLLNCRKVSKFWNKAASSVLRKRSTMIQNLEEDQDLLDLEECLDKSWDFPLAGLKFYRPWRFSAGKMAFLQKHGDNFTSLKFGTSWETRIEDLALLVNHLPRLSILEICLWGDYLPKRYRSTPRQFAAGQEGDRVLNLSSLRILRISSKKDSNILREVCTVASPSVKIECLNATYAVLRALKETGKLQAVTSLNSVNYDYDNDDMSLVDLLLSETPALTTLQFDAVGCISRNGLMKLLRSSQHTLKYLSLKGINPSEFSLECPVLPNLTTLSLCVSYQSCECEYIFQGSHGHKFPALKKLKLETTHHEFNPRIPFSDSLFVVPSLTTIHLKGHGDSSGIKDLARSFPNVIEIRLKHQYYGDDRSKIWDLGEFKFLEKLEIWDYSVQAPSKNYMNMDRFLTGIPTVICQNLRKRAQQNLMDSPFNEILRGSPSILQLKNLKELTVCVKLDHRLKELPEDEEPPFISLVSLWYALQMMPNLEARFFYEYDSPSCFFEERNRDKAVAMLKTAFKHVHPHVILEPFFY